MQGDSGGLAFKRTNAVLFGRCDVSHVLLYVFLMSFFFFFFSPPVWLQGVLRHCSHPLSQHTMAGFRQEDVELYYEMGEELGRYL